MRSRAYTTPCPGYRHRPPADDIGPDRRAPCPVCGRRVKVVLRARFPEAGDNGQLARHGFTEGPFVGVGGITADEARAQLRMAELEYRQHSGPYWAAVRAREKAAWIAGRAGITDQEIAEIYGIPRQNVSRMRARHEAKMHEQAAGEDEVGRAAEV